MRCTQLPQAWANARCRNTAAYETNQRHGGGMANGSLALPHASIAGGARGWLLGWGVGTLCLSFCGHTGAVLAVGCACPSDAGYCL